MTDIVSPATGAPAVTRATRRDIGIKRRYAAERRFRHFAHVVPRTSIGGRGPKRESGVRQSLHQPGSIAPSP